MKAFEQKRRSLLITGGALGFTGLLPQSIIDAESAREVYVLGATSDVNCMELLLN